MRFNAQTATIENGFVYVLQQAPWLAEYIHEITTFPERQSTMIRLISTLRRQLSLWMNQGAHSGA